MGGLFGSTPKIIPEFTGLQVNTSVQVLPIPIAYGAPRMNMNLLYYNGFNIQKSSAGSGKGVLSGGKSGETIEYFATLIMGLGEGPIPTILIIYQDQATYVPSDYPSNGASYFTGTDSQAAWSYITSRWPNDARTYKDTAYYGFANAQLDSSATVPQIAVVPLALLSGTSPLNDSTITITTGQYDTNGNPVSFFGNIHLGTCDADPAQVIWDILTNPRYGAGFPFELISTSDLFTSINGFNANVGDSALSTYCQAVGFAWSMVINNPASTNSLLERWSTNLVIATFWDGAMLRFVPYWDQNASGNPGWSANAGIALKYFTPYTTPITAILQDQVLQPQNQEDDPVTWNRKDPMQVYNTVRVDYKDRTNFFNDVPSEAKDEAHEELYGPRVDNIGTADEFTLKAYADTSAQAQLARNINILTEYSLRLSPLWAWMSPMDVLDIPNPSNLAQSVTVRVISIEDAEDESITVTFEEYPVGTQSPLILPTGDTTPPNQGATNVICQQAFMPFIFEPTTDMLTATSWATPAIIIGTTGELGGEVDIYWGGANVYVSLDDIHYQPVGQFTQPSTMGFLMNNKGPTDITMQVDLSISGGTMDSFGAAAANAHTSLICLKDASGFELMSYSTATALGNNQWLLSGLRRGLYGTTARSFAAGTPFLSLCPGTNYFEIGLAPQYIDQVFWIKLQSFNSYSNYTIPLSQCTAWQYMSTGSTPAAPGALLPYRHFPKRPGRRAGRGW